MNSLDFPVILADMFQRRYSHCLLRLIEPFRIPQTGGFANALNVHRFIEAMKFSFAARSEVTDPVFVKDPERLDRFWKGGWADEIRPKITDVSRSFRILVWIFSTY